MSFLLTRTRLLDVLAGAPPLAVIIAPAGWGKSALLETAATSDLRVVPVSLGNSEGHPSLLVDALAQGLKRAYPGTAVGAVRAVAGLRTDEAPQQVLERTREALGVASLTLAFDEIERLPRGPVFEILRKLVREQPSATRLVFTSRQPLPPELGVGPEVHIGVRDLAFTQAEVAALVDLNSGVSGSDRELVRALMNETGGWPALVAARLRASRVAGVRLSEIAPALSPIVDEAIAHIRSEARFVLQVAAIVGHFERGLMQAIVSGEVPGSPEARRRLMRLEPPVVARAIDELVRSNLVIPFDAGTAGGAQGELQCLVGLQGVLRERFMVQDRAGWLEAHRRAAELRLTALGPQALMTITPLARQVGPDLVDLFAASGERERLLDILSRHAARLELELAANDENTRILDWIEALEAGPVPFWCDVLAGLALARRGESERAKERLERAREKLVAEKKESSLWRWQARLAEAQALVARAKGDFTDARSWLLRGLDQLGQTKKRGLPNALDEVEASALELRMSITLARLCRESTGWDKTREAVTQALAMLAREAAVVPAGAAGAVASERLSGLVGELRRVLVAGAFAAGDGVALDGEARREPADAIAQTGRVAATLLRDGSVERAIEQLRQVVSETREPVGQLLLVRLLEAGKERDKLLDDAAASGDPWVSLEVELRRPRDGAASAVASEGFSSAVQAESQATGPGRALELARDAYRRVGARWEETRLWLVLGAAAARRVDDGDGEIEAVVRPVDGVIEASQAAGFVVPWSFAGRGEPDPERRVRTLLLAGLRAGQDKSKAACRQELERLGIDTRVVATTAERAKAGGPALRRPVASGGAPFLQITRGGTAGLSSADYQLLVTSKAATSFVVCVPDQLVLNFGRQVSLGQKRVMMPLLLHLLRNPDESYSMLELAREIWDSQELTPTVQTKVKVAVSRLRALLGKSRNYIITTRKAEGGESVVAYQTAPQLQFQIIETAPRE